MNEITFKDLKINYICKRTLKNSYISIKPYNENDCYYAKITLKTPKVSSKFITDLLIQKESWIRKQILKIEQNPPKKINIEDEVLLFGEIYSIDTEDAKELRDLLQKVKIDNPNNILKCYDDFYKIYAKKYLIPKVKYFSQIMNLNYKEIRFRKMKSRWGSCGSNRVITLNTELIKIKKELIDYVIVHELAHLVHMNHSRNFHNLVERYISDSKEIRKELKKINS